MPRLSCNEAKFRLEAIQSEMEVLDAKIAEFARTGDQEIETRILKLEAGIEGMVKELRRSIEPIPEGHFRLEHIPNWNVLADPETLKKDFKFDWIWEKEYRQERSLSDFEVQSTIEAEPIAKLFEIDEALTTSQILEAIDKAGYRPAALQELLAFGRDYWDPEKTPYVIGLNSVFSGADGLRLVPFLYWHGSERRLSANAFENDWSTVNRFLVLRKSSGV